MQMAHTNPRSTWCFFTRPHHRYRLVWILRCAEGGGSILLVSMVVVDANYRRRRLLDGLALEFNFWVTKRERRQECKGQLGTMRVNGKMRNESNDKELAYEIMFDVHFLDKERQRLLHFVSRSDTIRTDYSLFSLIDQLVRQSRVSFSFSICSLL